MYVFIASDLQGLGGSKGIIYRVCSLIRAILAPINYVQACLRMYLVKAVLTAVNTSAYWTFVADVALVQLMLRRIREVPALWVTRSSYQA